MNGVMNGESLSSGNGFWHDSLLGATCEKIDSTIGEWQCRNFRQTVDGGVSDGMCRDGVMESVNGVDKTSPHVHVDHS